MTDWTQVAIGASVGYCIIGVLAGRIVWGYAEIETADAWAIGALWPLAAVLIIPRMIRRVWQTTKRVYR